MQEWHNDGKGELITMKHIGCSNFFLNFKYLRSRWV